VAGDIVRTVATQPTLTDVAVLAIIVLIRTFLSFSLDVELTGHWPWRKDSDLLLKELPRSGYSVKRSENGNPARVYTFVT
jgi:hypothetical protein